MTVLPHTCNELWLWFITVSFSDRRCLGRVWEEGEKEREMSTREESGTISPHRFGLCLIISHLTHSRFVIIPMMICSFFVANTLCVYDCVGSLQWLRLPSTKNNDAHDSPLSPLVHSRFASRLRLRLLTTAHGFLRFDLPDFLPLVPPPSYPLSCRLHLPHDPPTPPTSRRRNRLPPLSPLPPWRRRTATSVADWRRWRE